MHACTLLCVHKLSCVHRADVGPSPSEFQAHWGSPKGSRAPEGPEKLTVLELPADACLQHWLD